MKLTVTITRDMIDDKGELACQEETTLEVDSTVDAPAVFETFARAGVFAEYFPEETT